MDEKIMHLYKKNSMKSFNEENQTYAIDRCIEYTHKVEDYVDDFLRDYHKLCEKYNCHISSHEPLSHYQMESVPFYAKLPVPPKLGKGLFPKQPLVEKEEILWVWVNKHNF